MKTIVINLNFYNIFKLYFVFIVFYAIVFHITKTCNMFKYYLDIEYNNMVKEICKDLDDMNNEYKLFCKAQDNYFNKQTQKEYNKSKKYFKDLSEHIFNDIKNNIIILNQQIENSKQKIELLVFGNNNKQNT